MKKGVVDPHYAKSKEYRKVILEINQKGKCPFCADNFKYHKHPILKRSGDWFATKISWPYKNTRLHFLIIGEKHKEKVSELTSKDMKSIFTLLQWLEMTFELPGGAFAMRFGETSYTGATVCHLHCHVIVPKLNARTKRAKTVVFPVG